MESKFNIYYLNKEKFVYIVSCSTENAGQFFKFLKEIIYNQSHPNPFINKFLQGFEIKKLAENIPGAEVLSKKREFYGRVVGSDYKLLNMPVENNGIIFSKKKIASSSMMNKVRIKEIVEV